MNERRLIEIIEGNNVKIAGMMADMMDEKIQANNVKIADMIDEKIHTNTSEIAEALNDVIITIDRKFKDILQSHEVRISNLEKVVNS